jgi:cell division septation protein DedD
MLALLSACATTEPVAAIDQTPEAVQYQSHAAKDYTPPGPPGDPWGPYITIAASRFDVPIAWIRAVMRVESGGRLYEGGGLITSPVGAMGLMQVMPETYDELRQRYLLSDDAYDPYNNILAGTAYIRELYDLYGSPAFLAAYNAGPARLEDYLNNRRGLPDETRHYVAKAGPYVVGIEPDRRSPAEDLAMNQLPLEIPTGLRYPRPVRTETRVAAVTHKTTTPSVARAGRNEHGKGERPVEVAQLPEPPRDSSHGNATARVQTVSAKSSGLSLHLITPASAETLPAHSGGGSWAIQVGAFASEGDARHAADSARGSVGDAHSTVGSVKVPHGVMYRARFVGLSRDSAVQACEKLSHGRKNCIVLSPDAQS